MKIYLMKLMRKISNNHWKLPIKHKIKLKNFMYL